MLGCRRRPRLIGFRGEVASGAQIGHVEIALLIFGNHKVMVFEDALEDAVFLLPPIAVGGHVRNDQLRKRGGAFFVGRFVIVSHVGIESQRRNPHNRAGHITVHSANLTEKKRIRHAHPKK